MNALNAATERAASAAGWQTAKDAVVEALKRTMAEAGFTPGDRRAFLSLPAETQIEIEVLEGIVHELGDRVREMTR